MSLAGINYAEGVLVIEDDMKSRLAEQRSRALTVVQALATVMAVLLAGIQSARAQFTFETNNGSITIIGYTGAGGAVVIPGTTNGYAVTVIGDYSFAYSTSLTSVAIPSSVTNIGEDVFLGCSGLTNFSVNASNAWFSSTNGVLFDEGQDTLIAYPEGLTNGTYAIPKSVTSIGPYAFANCSSLTGLVVPSNVSSIGEFAFSECSGLTSVFMLTLTNNGARGVTNIGPEAFTFCTNLTSVIFPDTILSVGPEVFAYCFSLVRVHMSTRATNIGAQAFEESGLINIIIPGNITSIGAEAFAYCPSLTGAVIPGSVTGLDGLAFAFCTNLTSAYFQGNAPPDVGNAFYGDPATIYYPPATNGWGSTFGDATTVMEPPPSEFYYGEPFNGTIMGLYGTNRTVIIPASINGIPVTSIAGGPNGLLPSSVTNVNIIIPDSVTSIGLDAFAYSFGLVNLVIPGSVTSIGQDAFTHCQSLTSIAIPNSVTDIGIDAFNSSGLTNIVIPNSVTNIGQLAFENCRSLTSVTIGNNVPAIGVNVFGECTSLTSVTIPGSVTNIAGDAFYDCSDLTNAIIGANVTSIGAGAFYGCASLTIISVDAASPVYSSLNGVLCDKTQDTIVLYPPGLSSAYTIPGSVTSIGPYAFYGCSLTNIIIPYNVASIGQEAFYGCGMTSVTILSGVTNIGFASFYLCTGLTSVTIPASVTGIEQEAFYACYNLTNFSVDAANPAYSSLNGVLFDKAQDTLVDYPPALKNATYTIPESVSSLGQYAFAFCASLTSAYFQGNAPSIVGGTFYGVPTTVYYLPGTTGWGAALDDAPTALWFQPQPTVLNFEPSFGVQNNQFGFTISWATNAAVVVQACTNLANPIWIPVATNALSSGTNYFSDAQWTNYPSRFYRVSGP